MNILFVCSGNTCRSSGISTVFREMVKGCLDKSGKPIVVDSAGTNADPGKPMTDKSQIAINMIYNIPFSVSEKHRSKQITKEMLMRADKVFVMGYNHLQKLNRMFPEYKNKVKLFMSVLHSDEEVSDPYGQSQGVYDECLEMVKPALIKLKKDICS